MDWRPATIDQVRAIVAKNLHECDPEQIATWNTYAVEPFLAPIERYGKAECVVVVARRGNEVMYWEDVDQGFNISSIAADGRILEHWCNQDELKHSLNAWIEGREIIRKVRPATRL